MMNHERQILKNQETAFSVHRWFCARKAFDGGEGLMGDRWALTT
jgi:hypothetical protein